jgi:hypothetical protein
MEWPREGGTDDEGFDLTDLDEPNHDILAASHLQGATMPQTQTQEADYIMLVQQVGLWRSCLTHSLWHSLTSSIMSKLR